MKKFLALFTMVLFILSLGIAQAQDETVLIIGHAEATDSLDPARGYTQTTGVVNKATYETLVTFPDANAGAIEPLLATEWSISEDGLSYTFTLREGVTFASGNALTAADVVYSFNRLANIDGSPSFLADNIASVTADGDLSVTITLTAADPSFLTVIANSAFAITDSATIAANGGSDAADAATADAAETFLNDTSAGSGPYVLEAWDPQVETVLVRNESYWGDAPYFDRVIITNIPEPATQAVALQSGEIDLALDLTADQIASLEGADGISIYRGPANIVHFLLMNQNPDIGGPVSNPLVQRAVRLALDYDGYQTLWGGIEPGSNLAFGLLGAYGEDQAVVRDLDAARALLAEAGYPDGFDITLEYPDFSFQGVNMNTNAQKIQADLAEVGINVTLAPGELQVSLEAYRSGQQGFGYWFWGPDKLDASDLLSFLPGGKVATERAQWLPENADPELLALIEQTGTTFETDARIALYGQLQDYLQESSPFAPFNQPDIQTAFVSSLQGYVWHPQWLLDVAILSEGM
ncbi:MAG: ABC transporter substrate-binding protein [Chloroflexota bacterium]|nr:ABC transporter substrate-binding protein [Chloroflexota bacterium]